MGWLKDWFDGILGKVQEMSAYVPAAKLAGCTNVEILDMFYNHFPQWMKDTDYVTVTYNSRKAELTAEEMITKWDAVKKAASVENEGLAKSLYDGFGSLADTAENSVAAIITNVLPSESPALIEAFDPAIETLMAKFFTALEYGDVQLDEQLKTDITDKITPLFKLLVTFEAGSWLAEWISPMKNSGIRHVAHALYDVVGFKALTAAYIDPLKLNLVAQPVKYAINELTLPFVPRIGDALEWYGRGHIDEAEFAELRAKAGIEAKWDYRYQRMGTKASSYFMLNAIAKEGYYDPDDFLFWLSDAGYGAFPITTEMLTPYEVEYGLKAPSTTQIDFLLDAYKHMNISATVADVRGIRKSLLAKGWITREEFEADLALYKITSSDAKAALDALEQKEEVEEKTVLVKAWEKRYMYGRITEEELTQALLALGVKESKIKSRLELMNVMKAGKLTEEGAEKRLTVAKIVGAYKDGRRMKGWAINELDMMGYTIEDAALQVEEVDQDIRNDAIAEWIRTYESRTLYFRMTIEELKVKYVELGKTEEWAEARAAYMEERLMGKEEVEE